MARAVHMLRPRLMVAENVRGLLSASADSELEPCPWCLGDRQHCALRALGAVLGDLASLGYDALWCGLRAADVGAPHGRFRVFLVAADADRLGPIRGGGPRRRWGRPAHLGDAVADTESDGRDERWAKSNGLVGGPDAAVGSGLHWGDYAPAIRRWEHITGRVAPAPTRTGRRGGQQLSPAFVEWMMGLSAGHVTDVDGLSRADQLRLLGNGVVPQQAAAALTWLLGHEDHDVVEVTG